MGVLSTLAIDRILANSEITDLLDGAGMSPEWLKGILEKEMKDTTVPAEWLVNGMDDPFKGDYKCNREDLTMGNVSDYALANQVFMFGDQRPPIEDVIAGKAKMPIVYLTAAKERIRWLSFQLHLEQTKNK